MLLVHPVNELVRFLPLVVAVFVLGSTNQGDPWHYLGVALPIALGLIRFASTSFRITGSQIELRRGIVSRRTLTAPLDRVRTVELTSSLDPPDARPGQGRGRHRERGRIRRQPPGAGLSGHRRGAAAPRRAASARADRRARRAGRRPSRGRGHRAPRPVVGPLRPTDHLRGGDRPGRPRRVQPVPRQRDRPGDGLPLAGHPDRRPAARGPGSRRPRGVRRRDVGVRDRRLPAHQLGFHALPRRHRELLPRSPRSAHHPARPASTSSGCAVWRSTSPSGCAWPAPAGSARSRPGWAAARRCAPRWCPPAPRTVVVGVGEVVLGESRGRLPPHWSRTGPRHGAAATCARSAPPPPYRSCSPRCGGVRAGPGGRS